MQPADDHSAAHDCAQATALSRLLDADEVDAAINTGLMAFKPCASCEQQSTANVMEFQQRLAKAWAARDRYLSRTARLARLTSARDARRSGVRIEKKSSLPPSVAAILARAKAKAAERGAQ